MLILLLNHKYRLQVAQQILIIHSRRIFPVMVIWLQQLFYKWPYQRLLLLVKMQPLIGHLWLEILWWRRFRLKLVVLKLINNMAISITSGMNWLCPLKNWKVITLWSVNRIWNIMRLIRPPLFLTRMDFKPQCPISLKLLCKSLYICGSVRTVVWPYHWSPYNIIMFVSRLKCERQVSYIL